MQSEKSIKIGAVSEFKVPRVPNFILGMNGENKRSLGTFTDPQLKAIGRRFTVNLLERARQQREEVS